VPASEAILAKMRDPGTGVISKRQLFLCSIHHKAATAKVAQLKSGRNATPSPKSKPITKRFSNMEQAASPDEPDSEPPVKEAKKVKKETVVIKNAVSPRPSSSSAEDSSSLPLHARDSLHSNLLASLQVTPVVVTPIPQPVIIPAVVPVTADAKLPTTPTKSASDVEQVSPLLSPFDAPPPTVSATESYLLAACFAPLSPPSPSRPPPPPPPRSPPPPPATITTTPPASQEQQQPPPPPLSDSVSSLPPRDLISNTQSVSPTLPIYDQLQHRDSDAEEEDDDEPQKEKSSQEEQAKLNPNLAAAIAAGQSGSPHPSEIVDIENYVLDDIVKLPNFDYDADNTAERPFLFGSPELPLVSRFDRDFEEIMEVLQSGNISFDPEPAAAMDAVAVISPPVLDPQQQQQQRRQSARVVDVELGKVLFGVVEQVLNVDPSGRTVVLKPEAAASLSFVIRQRFEQQERKRRTPSPLQQQETPTSVAGSGRKKKPRVVPVAVVVEDEFKIQLTQEHQAQMATWPEEARRLQEELEIRVKERARKQNGKLRGRWPKDILDMQENIRKICEESGQASRPVPAPIQQSQPLLFQYRM
jgi:hypothetical protein